MIFDRISSKLSLRRRRPGFHSPLGGLWTDRLDAADRLERRLRAGELTDPQAQRLRDWIEHGFVVLPGAVPAELADGIRRRVEAAWESLDPGLSMERDGAVTPLDPALRSKHYKLLDLYVRSREALEAAFAPAVREFLRLVFERDLLLFQGLSFERGSGDPIHQDTSTVVVTSPLEFAAAWIALEDLRPGSGELEYYVGSHRLPEFYFAGRYRNWNRERDGVAVRDEYLASLHVKAHEMGLERQSFLPRKGDVLIWSADLAHGGTEIRDREATRWSFVCHYCPRGVKPYYFSYKPKQRAARRAFPGCWYSSSHYALGRAGT